MREDNREVQIFILNHSQIQDILFLVVLVINLIMTATVGMVMMVTALVPMTILAIMVVMVITALVVVPTLSMVPTPTQSPLLQLETAPEYRSMQSAPNATFLV